MANPDEGHPPQYYDKGSTEIAVETPVMRARLEKRRALSSNSERLLIVMCGLPARGKSFLSRKLANYLTWRGNRCRVFNVGKYRRQAAEGVQHADFFDDSNENAAKIRQKAAELALKDTLKWLEEETSNDEDDDETGYASGSLFIGHTSHSSRRQTQRIAIFDATNSTRSRRDWILQQCDEASEVSGKETGVVFVESICDDKELLAENYNVKISSSPDFHGMSREEALADLKARIAKYEARYETVDDDSSSYVKVFNLSSKLMVNHFYGRLAKVIVPALMAWNVGSRPIFLCRSGETSTDTSPRPLQPEERRPSDLSSHGHITKRQRGDRLTERGLEFRDALCKFVEREGREYMEKSTNVVHPRKFDTGTSMSGLREHRREQPLFPCLIMSSTMPRALETAKWQKLPFPIKDVSNLNPLDMGDFSGMTLESIRSINPEWYHQLEQEPFHTRFPGGESYSDLINRLESVIIDVEQQLGPAVVVSHVSVLQVLVSYFRSTPITDCTGIEIPMHTVFKFAPLRGGGWLESQHNILPAIKSRIPTSVSMPLMPTGLSPKMESAKVWCRTASLLGGFINISKAARKTDVKMHSLDLTKAVDWMQFIEESEGRQAEKGGSGAYDTLRCDLSKDKVHVWGRDFHLKRLQESYLSLIQSNETAADSSHLAQHQIKRGIEKARNVSSRMLDAVLRQARNAIQVPSANEFPNGDTKNSTPVQIVRFTWLWSPSKAQLEGKSVCDIVVRAHAVCRGELVCMPPKVVPVTCTIAVDAPHEKDGAQVIIDSSLPSRFDNPLNKVASWTRERKVVEKYKSSGAEEVLLVRPLGDTTGSVELLEGLSSNVFVLYTDNTLHTPNEGVLHGYVRHLVLEAAKSSGLRVSAEPILLEDVGQWKEAFITSSSRLIFPISKLLVPRDGNFVEFWMDPVLANDASRDANREVPKWKELLDEIIRRES